MPVAPEVLKAIEQAAQSCGQGEAVPRLLAAWFEDVSSGNETLEERRTWERRVKILIESIELPDLLEE